MLNKLQKGDCIGIITPASSFDSPEVIRDGLSYLNHLGFTPCIGEFVYGSNHHFSGSPQERAADIMTFFKDPKIKAIIATCGGWGSQAVLPYLDYEIIKQNSKPIIGFSDITALQNAVYAKANIASLAGIMLKYDFYNTSVHPQTAQSFEACLCGQFVPISQGVTLNSGKADGVLVGGNLCTFVSLAGTPYFPSLKQKIIFLEDFDEKTYRIERMLTQLEQQKDFEQVSAIIFGNFGSCNLNHPEDNDIETIVNNFATRHPDLPIVKHFPHGHIKARFCIPIGVSARLIASPQKTSLQIIE